jgi:hypothetical protein
MISSKREGIRTNVVVKGKGPINKSAKARKIIRASRIGRTKPSHKNFGIIFDGRLAKMIVKKVGNGKAGVVREFLRKFVPEISLKHMRE